MNAVAMKPSWLDSTLYPFESKFFQLKEGRVHYIDEGKGKPILFVHGTPTWSFLYRDFIKALSAGNRCVAIDHLGFGLSDKPETFSGTPQAHAQNLSTFIQQKNLRNITLVVHDFGGPIGLGAALKNVDRIDKIVLLNTWLWGTKNNEDALKIDKLINGWLGKMLYLNFNFSPKVLLKKGFLNPKLLSRSIHQHYTKPFPTKKSRLSLLNIAKALVGASDWYEEQWVKLDKLAQKDWLILWGKEDQFIGSEYLTKWKKRLPMAEIQEYDCGHFVQEEATQVAINAIQQFQNKVIQ